jgi:hypothetical protein
VREIAKHESKTNVTVEDGDDEGDGQDDDDDVDDDDDDTVPTCSIALCLA